MLGVRKARSRRGPRKVEVTATLDLLRRRGLLQIIERVAQRHWLTVEQVLEPVRSPLRASARRELFAWLRQKGFSFPEIGEVFGRDHSTVMEELRGGVVMVGDRLAVANHRYGERKLVEPEWSADDAARVIVDAAVAGEADEGDW